MDTQAAEATLKDYLLQGVAKEIFFADEAKSITVAIGNHAEQLNAQGFGGLFYSLQLAYSDRQTLCVAKMFDAKKHRYPIRSIPAILKLIEDYTSRWSLPQRHSLEAKLISAGHERQQVQTADNASLVHLLVLELRRTMPKVEQPDIPGLSASLTKLREARDKVIAHNEAVNDSARRPTWGEVEELVAYAKNFVTLISFGFLNLHMGTDSESYDQTYVARRSSAALLRLLKSAKLVP